MPSMRSLLQKLAITAGLGSFMAASATSIGSVSIVSHTTPPATISSEAPPGCTDLPVMIPQEAVGGLRTALSSASITYSVVPSVPCSVLAVLPSSLQDDFADFETRWYNWWQTKRSDFSEWASTCAGNYTGTYSTLANEYLNATSSMDAFTPRVTDCADFTGSGIEATPTGTGAGAASETGASGQNGGNSFRLQSTAAISVFVATLTGIIFIM